MIYLLFRHGGMFTFYSFFVHIRFGVVTKSHPQLLKNTLLFTSDFSLIFSIKFLFYAQIFPNSQLFPTFMIIPIGNRLHEK